MTSKELAAWIKLHDLGFVANVDPTTRVFSLRLFSKGLPPRPGAEPSWSECSEGSGATFEEATDAAVKAARL